MENGSENRPRRFLAALCGLSLGLLLAGAAGEVAAQSRVQPGPAAADPVVVSLFREPWKAVAEEVGHVLIRVDLSRTLEAGERVEVPFVISGSGVAPEDFDLRARRASRVSSFDTLTPRLVFDAGDSFIWLTLDPIADGIDEGGSETITFSLGSDAQFDAPGLETNVAGGADPHATDNRIDVVILDEASTISVFAEADSITEGQTAKFTFTADPAPKADIVLRFLLYDLGPTYARTWILERDDGLHDLTIPANETTLDYLVPTIDTPSYEAWGTVRLALHSPPQAGYKFGENGFAYVEIVDNDDPPPVTPVVSISGGAAVTEGGDATFNVTASPAPGANLSVALAVAQTGDFAAPGAIGANKTVVVGASGSATYAVATIDDETEEPNGAIRATLAGGAGYAVADPPNNAASVAVNDNDDPPPVTPVVSISGGAAVTEGGDATFNVTASPAPGANLSVELAVAQTGDFAAPGAIGANKIVVVGASGSATYTVATVNDETDEPNGSITATLAGGVGYTVADPPNNAASVAVNDNDTDDPPPVTPVVSISGGAAVTEGGDATFNVTASPAPGANLSVELAVAQTGDFAAPGAIGANKTVVVGASGSATYTVATIDDETEEPNGAIRATLAGGAGYAVADPPNNAASVAVNDNDNDQTVTPEVTLSASPNPVSEGNPVTVTASISRALPDAVTIPLVLTAGSAEAGDYGALASIEIPANEASGTGEITTELDSDTEDETFTVALGDLPGIVAAGTPASVALRITDNTSVISIESPGDEIPAAFALEQNYPNPFNPSTTIEFALDKTQHVTLSVYDLLGQEVRTLVDGVQPAARYRVSFDASDLASGAYLYALRTEEQTAVKTMALLK